MRVIKSTFFILTSIFALALFIGPVIFLSLPGAAQTTTGTNYPITIESTTAAVQDVEPEETVTYEWSMQNVANSTHIVSILVSPPASGWTVRIRNPTLPLVAGESASVNLTVTAPSEKQDDPMILTITFQVKKYQESDGGSTVFFEQTESITANAIETKKEEKKKELPKVFFFFDNPFPAPLDNEYGVFILELVFWLVVGIIVMVTMDPIIRKATEKTATEIDDVIIGILRVPVIVIIFLYGFAKSPSESLSG